MLFGDLWSSLIDSLKRYSTNNVLSLLYKTSANFTADLASHLFLLLAQYKIDLMPCQSWPQTRYTTWWITFPIYIYIYIHYDLCDPFIINKWKQYICNLWNKSLFIYNCPSVTFHCFMLSMVTQLHLPLSLLLLEYNSIIYHSRRILEDHVCRYCRQSLPIWGCFNVEGRGEVSKIRQLVLVLYVFWPSQRASFPSTSRPNIELRPSGIGWASPNRIIRKDLRKVTTFLDCLLEAVSC